MKNFILQKFILILFVGLFLGGCQLEWRKEFDMDFPVFDMKFLDYFGDGYTYVDTDGDKHKYAKSERTLGGYDFEGHYVVSYSSSDLVGNFGTFNDDNSFTTNLIATVDTTTSNITVESVTMSFSYEGVDYVYSYKDDTVYFLSDTDKSSGFTKSGEDVYWYAGSSSSEDIVFRVDAGAGVVSTIVKEEIHTERKSIFLETGIYNNSIYFDFDFEGHLCSSGVTINGNIYASTLFFNGSDITINGDIYTSTLYFIGSDIIINGNIYYRLTFYDKNGGNTINGSKYLYSDLTEFDEYRREAYVTDEKLKFKEIYPSIE